MNNVVTEVSTQGYVSRIGQSIKGIFTGILLIVIGVGLLWWNEGRTVKQHQALNEVGSNVTSVLSDTVNPEYEGKLIHTNGSVKTEEILKDETFAIETPGLAIERTVEMYQWKEIEKTEKKNNTGGSQTTTTTYTYETVWSDKSIDSSSFKEATGHTNPDQSLSSSRVLANEATLGGFKFESDKINKLGGFTSLAITPEQLNQFPAEFGEDAAIKGGYAYSHNNSQPKVGDYRVKFSFIPNETDTSILGQQEGSSILAYTAENGNDILLIKSGLHTHEAMVEAAQKQNTMVAWLIRGGGTLLIIIGIGLILAPLAVFASVLPFLGSITGAFTGGIAFVLGLFISLMTIGMAWVFYRPILGISLLVAAIASLSLLFFMRKKSADTAVQEPTQAVATAPTPPVQSAAQAPQKPAPTSNPFTNQPAVAAPIVPAQAMPQAPVQPTSTNPAPQPAVATPPTPQAPIQAAPTSTPAQPSTAQNIAQAPAQPTPTNTPPQPPSNNPFA